MADKAEPVAELEESKQQQPAEKAQDGGLVGRFSGKRLLHKKTLAVLLCATIAIQAVCLGYYKFKVRLPASEPSEEVELGRYCFVANAMEQGQVVGAEFTLHIALLAQVDEEAQARLAERKFRVQQDVEQLLRQAHAGDFDDPKLGELKRELQEQINETLGMRAIAEVIITNLSLQRSPPAAQKPTMEMADSLPWMEKPSG